MSAMREQLAEAERRATAAEAHASRLASMPAQVELAQGETEAMRRMLDEQSKALAELRLREVEHKRREEGWRVKEEEREVSEQHTHTHTQPAAAQQAAAHAHAYTTAHHSHSSSSLTTHRSLR